MIDNERWMGDRRDPTLLLLVVVLLTIWCVCTCRESQTQPNLLGKAGKKGIFSSDRPDKPMSKSRAVSDAGKEKETRFIFQKRIEKPSFFRALLNIDKRSAGSR